METFFPEEGASDCDCEVRIDGNTLIVSYIDDGEHVVYRGDAITPGHFELTANNGGRATLHQLYPDDEWLEGSWIEGGARGMWRIQLLNDQ